MFIETKDGYEWQRLSTEKIEVTEWDEFLNANKGFQEVHGTN